MARNICPPCREAARLDHGSAKAHTGLGDSLQGSGRFEEAAAAYREAARLDPGSAKAHTGLAVALMMTGESGEAQWAYERAVDLDPGTEMEIYWESNGWGT